MEREEIISAIEKYVARCGGVCYTEGLYIKNTFSFEDLNIVYVEDGRVVLEDDYYTFDELTDDELERVLDAVKFDYSNITKQDLFAMACKECSFDVILDKATAYISEGKIRDFLTSCLLEDRKGKLGK